MDIPQNPVVLWQHLHQIILYLFRLLLQGQAKLSGNPLYMGIHHNAWHMINISPDHISRLSPHARKGGQILQRLRYLT